ncbi:MAG TPA: MEKHLA domain-containing protein [Nitrospiria bacterium]|nr:MEKHLA domain-containing protein [Nitrospiria bacterium]
MKIPPSHIALLLKSFRHWTGRELVSMEGSDEEIADRLFQAPFVVLSHGTEEDPILNYGNQAALDLWEMDWKVFTKMPSRLTAEPGSREERARLLKEVAEKGFTDAYRGVRISQSGRRFLVERATVWNLIDDGGNYKGQAAMFRDWKYL